MNIVAHIFRKDVRHLRWLLAAWFFMVILQAGLMATGVAAWRNDAALQVAMSILGMLVPVLKWILLIVLVPLLIQDEPLTGHTAFWFTRPIGRCDLLKSKSAFLAGLIILPPMLAEFAALVYYRVDPTDLALALPEMLWQAVLGLLPLVALAVVTSTFARFAIAAVSVFASVMLASFLWQMIRMFTDMEGMMAAMAQPSLEAARGMVSGVVTFVVLGAAIVHQYRTRHTRNTVLIMMAYGVLTAAVGQFWKWDFMAVQGAATPEAATLDGVAVRIRSQHSSDVSSMRPGQNKEKQVRASLECDQLPPAHFAGLKTIDAHVVFSDGKTQDYVSRNPEFDFDSNPDAGALSSLLAPIELVGERMTSYSRSGNLLRLPVDLYDQYRFDEAELKAEAVMQLQRYEVLARLPLRTGEEVRVGSTAMTISDVLKNSGGCTVVMGQRRLFLMFKREGGGAGMMERFSPKDIYALVNPRLGEAYLSDRDFDFNFNPFGASERLRVDTPRLAFQLKQGDSDVLKPEAEIEDWLQDAELWWIGVREAGTFRALLHEKPFQLDDRDGSGKRVPINTNALAALVIPDQPTREQAQELVQQIYQISRRQNRWGSHDPQIALLAKVGPGNMEVLLQSLRTCDRMSFYLERAIGQLADDTHKELILSYVKRNPSLVVVVKNKGWLADLDPAVAAPLRKSERYGSFFE